MARSKLLQAAGKVIVQLRKEKGLTQEIVAFDLDLDRHYMSDIELGKRNYSIGILQRICDYYNISLGDFFIKVEDYQEKEELGCTA